MTTVPNATTPTTGTTASPAAQAATSSTSASGMESEFLTLLTTQLQNQDPTAPADTNQITQEMAMLGEVEQQTNTNTLLQQLISVMSTNQTASAVSYIGQQVDATGNQIQLKNSQTPLVYSLPSGASSAMVTITNAAGQMVFSGAGTTIAGRNQMVWDGSDSATGGTAPDGTYTFSVTAKDSSGHPVTATTYTTGKVLAVDSQNGSTSLSLGNISVPIGNVQSIYAAGTDPTA